MYGFTAYATDDAHHIEHVDCSVIVDIAIIAKEACVSSAHDVLGLPVGIGEREKIVLLHISHENLLVEVGSVGVEQHLAMTDIEHRMGILTQALEPERLVALGHIEFIAELATAYHCIGHLWQLGAEGAVAVGDIDGGAVAQHFTSVVITSHLACVPAA